MRQSTVLGHCRVIALCAFALWSGALHAADVSLVGVIGSKAAVLMIDGAGPRTVRVGETVKGVKVVAVAGEQAIIEIGDGGRRTIRLGHHVARPGAAAATDKRQRATIAADMRGHFFADGQVNGGSVRFLVDTGATTIALPGREATRLGLKYKTGTPSVTHTAAGPAMAYRVTLDSVRVGEIELQGIEAMVLERGLDVVLLGMSFLNRVEMRRENEYLYLVRRY